MGDSQSSLPNTFNLSEQSGVMQALLAVRTSGLSASQKNDLRDLIFTYTKSGGDERLREQLEQKLAHLPLSDTFIERQKEQQKTEARAGFAGGRRTPTFSVPQSSVSSSESSAVSPAPQAPEPAAAALPIKDESPTPVPSPTTPSPSLPTTPETSSANPSNVSAANVVPATGTPATSAVDVPSAVQPSDSIPPHTPSADTAPEPTIERIREIKRYINNSIGNPVNLVDRDADLGRAYMSALLAAMQSVNAETGRAGDAEMQKLEAVFVQVKPLLESSTASATVPAEPVTPAADVVTATSSLESPDTQPAPVPSKSAAAPDVAAVPPAPAASVQAASQPPTSAKPVAPLSADDVAAPPAPESSVVSPVPINRVSPATDVPAPSVSQIPKTERAAYPTAPDLSQSNFPPIFSGKQDSPDSTSEPQRSAQVPPPRIPNPTPSVADSTATTSTSNVSPVEPASAHNTDTIANKLQALDEKAAQNQYAGDPLYAPEVDAGLQQLLLEWTLFKSSGLFGTGPNAREHPLFKKLAPLMIQDVANGRFDDARPEVVQSITDYMNGWRYEQGIVYEPGETFEKYLRRVIRYILDGK